MRQKRSTVARGYTLMEVLIAMTLLALVLTVLLGTQATHTRVGASANEMAVATLLGRAKMLDIESELAADGFNEGEQTDKGDFRRDGFNNFRWEVKIEPVALDEGAGDQLLSQTNGQLFGEGEDGGGGTFTGSAAFASYLPLVVGLLPDFINRIGEKVRKVTLEIRWEGARGDQTLTLVQYLTDLKADEREEGLGNGQLPPGVDPGDGGGDLP
jgi:prepilin-type N-terminal cleavage/methylation domain-containing protein